MDRRGRLTYERLASSLERLQGAVRAQFSENKDSARAKDLRRVINNALDAARTGMSGAETATPFQLKREIEARIVDVHSLHNSIHEQREHATNHTTKTAEAASSTLSDIHAPPSSTPRKTPTSTRTPRSSSSGKENYTPPAPAHQPSKKISAVKKTAITPRTCSKLPSTAAGVKKRAPRALRSKPALLPAPPAPLPTTDEADRRAAAAVLLGLAGQSPRLNFTALEPLGSGGAPSASGRKRACDVYGGDDVEAHGSERGDAAAYTSPAPKRRVTASGAYVCIPELEEGMPVQQAFVRGVEYAVKNLSAREGGGEQVLGLLAFVRHELRLRDELRCVGSGIWKHGGEVDMSGGVRSQELRSEEITRSEDGGRGFWDVV